MKALVALVLAFAITPAFAGSINSDYTACKALVKDKHPESNIRLKKVRSKTMEFKVLSGKEITSVVCDRNALSLIEK